MLLFIFSIKYTDWLIWSESCIERSTSVRGVAVSQKSFSWLFKIPNWRQWRVLNLKLSSKSQSSIATPPQKKSPYVSVVCPTCTAYRALCTSGTWNLNHQSQMKAAIVEKHPRDYISVTIFARLLTYQARNLSVNPRGQLSFWCTAKSRLCWRMM